jgi:ABC-type antimicrobial peptide transport system permease subunit
MILGMSTPTFTMFHVILSLIGILTGIIVVFGMLSAMRRSAWTSLFLATAGRSGDFLTRN